MSDETTPIPTEGEKVTPSEELVTDTKEVSKQVLSVEVVLPSGDKVVLQKLKAGKYYEAQKLYLGWLTEMQKVLAVDTDEIAKAVDKDGKVSEEKLKEVTGKAKIDLTKMLSMTEVASSKRSEILAICMGKEQQELLDEYYPEDIETLLEAALELNNFMSNVKKSVAL